MTKPEAQGWFVGLSFIGSNLDKGRASFRVYKGWEQDSHFENPAPGPVGLLLTKFNNCNYLITFK